MKLDASNLTHALTSSLAPFYLLVGEETLLVNEAADEIRKAAHQQGFTEREVFHADSAHFDWSIVIDSLNSMSLFSSRKMIEIYSDRKNLTHQEFLSYWDRPNPDCVVMVITDNIEKKARSTAWFKQLDDAGVVIDFWPLEDQKLSRWLSQRAQRTGLTIDHDALALLQERTEGNLLAADQELEKLQLQFGKDRITAEKLHHAVADHARYDAFKLMDAALAGDASQTLRILNGLREEGTAIPAILWVITKDLHTLAGIHDVVAQGQRKDTYYNTHKIWPKKQAIYDKALQQLSRQEVMGLIHDVSDIDLAIKGMSDQEPVLLMENLCLRICGVKRPRVA